MINKKSTKEKILSSLKFNTIGLVYAGDDLLADRDVVLAAVTQNGLTLYHAREELKDIYLGSHFMLASGDKEVVLAAVKQNGLALEYASKELQNDRDVVLAAVRQDGRALEYASDELKSELKSEVKND